MSGAAKKGLLPVRALAFQAAQVVCGCGAQLSPFPKRPLLPNYSGFLYPVIQQIVIFV